jgi:1-acyl-sn-glycerol-3-phosphate acyltransferase
MFYKFARTLVLIVFSIWFRIKVHVAKDESIINDGEPLIICANHSSMLDPLIVAITFKDPIRYMAKKELFNNYFLSFILKHLGVFPIDREGNSLTALKHSLKLLKSNETLGIFPEGTRVKEYNESAVKGGIGMIVLRSKATVLPVYIESTFKPFTPVHIYYGSKINYSEEEQYGPKDYQKVSVNIMERIYSLKERIR